MFSASSGLSPDRLVIDSRPSNLHCSVSCLNRSEKLLPAILAMFLNNAIFVSRLLIPDICSEARRMFSVRSSLRISPLQLLACEHFFVLLECVHEPARLLPRRF